MKLIQDSSAMGQFGNAISQICEEKGLDKGRVIETIEAALAAAYKKDYGRKGQFIISKFDEGTGEVNFKQLKEVVDENTRNLENLEKIDEERMKEEVGKFSKAKKSAEEIEKVSITAASESGLEHIPKFNIDRDVLLEDAKKIKKDVQVGDYLEISLEPKGDYGRVASQTAKQVIIQRLREAERDAMFDEYKNKEGEIVNGTVQRIEGRNVFVDLGKSVGVIFPSNQIPGENYRIGQRLKVHIEKVESDPKGPGITLDRNSAELLRKLFELEVPEIFTGTVEIKAAAREAGSRSKIAVVSSEEGIDPIGSCVGQKGTRVQAVIDEIGGEKIDILEWSDDVEKLIASALAPAKVVKVETKEDESEGKKAVAYVPEDQLSLAIGRSGQNVRLAAKLTGWRVDVEGIGKEEAEEEEGVEAAVVSASPEGEEVGGSPDEIEVKEEGGKVSGEDESADEKKSGEEAPKKQEEAASEEEAEKAEPENVETDAGEEEKK